MDVQTIVLARDREAAKAWSALSRYKFWMFGYHASGWVRLNRLLPPGHIEPNPFRPLVDEARERIKQ